MNTEEKTNKEITDEEASKRFKNAHLVVEAIPLKVDNIDIVMFQGENSEGNQCDVVISLEGLKTIVTEFSKEKSE